MLSKDQIRNALLQVAENNNLTGDSVNLLVNELTYSLYHEQLEITNAIQESNLSTAYLLNSKIRNCMNVMYSVFRGRNCRVKLNFQNNTLIQKNKFDVLYTSNTFKVYAEEALNLVPSVDEGGVKGYNKYQIIGILADTNLYEVDITVNEESQYYIDMIEDRKVLSELSEDIQVFINGIEYPTTRNFYDHIQQSIPLKNNDAYKIGTSYYYVSGIDWIQVPETDPLVNDFIIKGELSSTTQLPKLPSGDLDAIFVLTIPDYGIRLFKRGYFNINDEVKIRALKYTTVDQINSDEFSKITIPGTYLTTRLTKSNEVRRSPELGEDGLPTYLDNGIVKEIERDNNKSLLYTANFYERLQAKMLSKSDINNLFTEYFIEQVRNAINWYDGKKDEDGKLIDFKQGKIYIFYVPKINKDYITNDQFNAFIIKYGSYFISNNMIAVSGVLLTIDVDLILYMNDSIEIGDSIENIFNNYANQLNDPNNLGTNLLKPKQIFADISKLPTVDYIDELSYISYTNEYNGATESLFNAEVQLLPPTSVFDEDSQINIPTYYQFNLNIVYKSSFELVQTRN